MVTSLEMWDKFMNTPSIECFELFIDEYKKSGELGDLRNHNMVLMDIGEWEQAKRNYTKIINEEQYSSESDFIEIGMSEWFLGNTSSAVEFWKQSLNAQYAPCPGAPDAPLILWYAGQRLSDEKLIKQSLNKLRRYWKITNYRELHDWRGTVSIAGLLIDKVPVSVFLHDWKDDKKGTFEDRRLCRAKFWAGMKCLIDNDETTAAAYFKSAFSYTKIAILQYEYFLAKWEYSRITRKDMWEKRLLDK